MARASSPKDRKRLARREKQEARSVPGGNLPDRPLLKGADSALDVLEVKMCSIVVSGRIRSGFCLEKADRGRSKKDACQNIEEFHSTQRSQDAEHHQLKRCFKFLLAQRFQRILSPKCLKPKG